MKLVTMQEIIESEMENQRLYLAAYIDPYFLFNPDWNKQILREHTLKQTLATKYISKKRADAIFSRGDQIREYFLKLNDDAGNVLVSDAGRIDIEVREGDEDTQGDKRLYVCRIVFTPSALLQRDGVNNAALEDA